MDRAYVDFERLFQLHQAGASFVTRAKKNLAWHRVYSSPKDREHGIQVDQLIALDGKRSQRAYPLHLRRVRYQDPDSGQRRVFLTNRRDLPAGTVCALYKRRWDVELFFKRFKSLAELGHLPKHDDESAKAWLYGKLLVALVVEKLIGHASAISPWGYRLASPATP